MAGTRISQFPNLPSGSLASEDVFLVVDISDTFYSTIVTIMSTNVGVLSKVCSGEQENIRAIKNKKDIFILIIFI